MAAVWDSGTTGVPSSHATGVCKSTVLMAHVCGSQRTWVCVDLRMGTGSGQNITGQDQMAVPALEFLGLKPWNQSPEMGASGGVVTSKVRNFWSV